MLVNDEIHILKQLQTGDEQAFKYLFDTYFVPLCRFMKLYLKDEAEIEEIAMDIFMHVWTNREEFQIKLSFKAYLFQAARNRCLNVLRDSKQTCPIDGLGETLSDNCFIADDIHATLINSIFSINFSEEIFHVEVDVINRVMNIFSSTSV